MKRAGLLVVVVTLLAGAPAASAQNLLANPGAEDGASAPDGRIPVPVPGWETSGGFTVAPYGLPGLPASGGSGRQLFAGGSGSAATAVQSVPLGRRTAVADLGRLRATFGAVLGSSSDPAELDEAKAEIAFLGRSGKSIVTVTYLGTSAFGVAGPMTAPSAAPPGTRAVRVTLTATRRRGSYDDGYFDDLSLSLREVEPPPPRLGASFGVRVLRGIVRVRPAGHTRFTRVRGRVLLAVGSEVDARRGQVVISTATNAEGVVQRGRFSGAYFRVTQDEDDGLTDLVLTRGEFGACRAGAARAAKTRFSSVRRLFGSAKGRFRVRGRYSAATVRGTVWAVEDTCSTTLTQVMSGEVQVEEVVRSRRGFRSPLGGGGGGESPSVRKVTVKAGETYSADGR